MSILTVTGIGHAFSDSPSRSPARQAPVKPPSTSIDPATLRQAEDDILRRADESGRRVQAILNWPDGLLHPGSTEAMDRAFVRGLAADPARALALLIDGAKDEDLAGPVRARRLLLIGWTIREGQTDQGPITTHVSDFDGTKILARLRGLSTPQLEDMARAFGARAARYDREILLPLEKAALARADRALARKIAVFDQWEQTIYRPEFPSRLDRAYFNGIRSNPTSAFRALMSGVAGDGQASKVFIRRLELLGWSLGAGQPEPLDEYGWAILGQIDSSDPLLPKGFRRQFDGERGQLRDEVLAATRAGWLPVDVAAQFAIAAGPERGVPDPAVLALAVARDPERADLARRLAQVMGRPDALTLIGDADLTVAETRALIRFAKATGAVDDRRLLLARDERLIALARNAVPPNPSSTLANSAEPVKIARRAGLFGRDDSIDDDLARLIQRQSLRDLVRRMSKPESNVLTFPWSGQPRPKSARSR
jgi:hypothetical protein